MYFSVLENNQALSLQTFFLLALFIFSCSRIPVIWMLDLLTVALMSLILVYSQLIIKKTPQKNLSLGVPLKYIWQGNLLT